MPAMSAKEPVEDSINVTRVGRMGFVVFAVALQEDCAFIAAMFPTSRDTWPVPRETVTWMKHPD